MPETTPDPIASMHAASNLWPQHGNTRLAEYLGVSSSRVREWLRGARPIPGGVQREIQNLLEQFPDGFHNVNPRATIRILHEAMQTQGFTAGEAAAGILGAAFSLAVKINGRAETLALMDDEAPPSALR